MFAIDAARSFTATLALAVEKKAGMDGELLVDKQTGHQKWSITVAAVMTPNGRRNQAEVIKVGVVSDKDLAGSVPVGPVELVGLRLGTFTNGDGQTTVYFQADEIRPAGGFPQAKATAHQSGDGK